MPARSCSTHKAANCRSREVKGLTTMVNSIYNGCRFEDLWLEQGGRQQHPREIGPVHNPPPADNPGRDKWHVNWRKR